MKSLPSASAFLFVVAALATGQACAEDYPNIVGTWERVTGMRAVRGTPQNKRAPVLTTKGESGLKVIKVTSQDSGVFEGEATLVDGENHFIAGAFRKDGKRYVMSSDIGALSGEVSGDEMEVCFTTLLTTINVAGCYQMKNLNKISEFLINRARMSTPCFHLYSLSSNPNIKV